MDLMLDPACEYTTFGEAVKVGWACDEERFFWYEDPYRDGGISQFAHRKLRQLIRTPHSQAQKRLPLIYRFRPKPIGRNCLTMPRRTSFDAKSRCSVG